VAVAAVHLCFSQNAIVTPAVGGGPSGDIDIDIEGRSQKTQTILVRAVLLEVITLKARTVLLQPLLKKMNGNAVHKAVPPVSPHSVSGIDFLLEYAIRLLASLSFPCWPTVTKFMLGA
jgi:hypothetical protein